MTGWPSPYSWIPFLCARWKRLKDLGILRTPQRAYAKAHFQGRVLHKSEVGCVDVALLLSMRILRNPLSSPSTSLVRCRAVFSPLGHPFSQGHVIIPSPASTSTETLSPQPLFPSTGSCTNPGSPPPGSVLSAKAYLASLLNGTHRYQAFLGCIHTCLLADRKDYLFAPLGSPSFEP